MFNDPIQIADEAQTASSGPRQPICPECGIAFKRNRPQQAFCCPAHKKAFQARMAVEGRAIAAIAKAWRSTRNNKANRELGSALLSELCSILDGFNAGDKDAGRPNAMEYAKGLMAKGRFIDRARSAR